jgi:hypothetical protein
VPALGKAWRLHAPRNRGVEAVGADDDVRRDITTDSALEGGDSRYTSAAVHGHVVHLKPIPDVYAASNRLVHEHAVEQRAAWCVQRGDAMFRLDRHGDVSVCVTERRGTDRRRAGRDDVRQHAPSIELQNRTAHQGVRRQPVGSVGPLVDQHHPRSFSREQHSRRRSGAACSDNNCIYLHDDSCPGTSGHAHARRAPRLSGAEKRPMTASTTFNAY